MERMFTQMKLGRATGKTGSEAVSQDGSMSWHVAIKLPSLGTSTEWHLVFPHAKTVAEQIVFGPLSSACSYA